jgi:NAD(P)-dependent dehydrogenase (short-subunit alcohol dehydrogenase family)
VEIARSVALVTGGNRGSGAPLCAALAERGAAKVYAGARDAATVTTPGVEAVRLDITSPADIAAAVAHCGHVTLLINNAGIGTGPACSPRTPCRNSSESSTRTSSGLWR